MGSSTGGMIHWRIFSFRRPYISKIKRNPPVRKSAFTYRDAKNSPSTIIKLMIRFCLKCSKLHNAKKPINSVMITLLCSGLNHVLEVIKSNGISEIKAKMNKRMPYFFLSCVFSKPIMSIKAKRGNANLPNISSNWWNEIAFPAIVNQVAVGQVALTHVKWLK